MSGVNRPELLSPAGSMESLKAAVNGGCDAVYLGGKQFSARQYAGNFDLKELEDACDYCHLRGVKVYVTVNTVYKDEELAGFLTYIRSLYEMGVDALIMQDTGAERLVKAHFPDFPLHASTQMTCNSLADVNYWEGRGFDKIVLSRELSLEEIRHITKNTEAEIETFVHGALCVCYSGQCIMSSMLGGRSGKAPCQTVGDLLSGRASGKLGVVEPSYKPGVVPCDLAELLPAPLIGAMREALPLLGRRLRGFDLPDAVLTGPETRSSSPVRISRDETFQSVSTLGLYPCGEGAGYAGGITSAAVDGVRCAEAILKAY